MRRPKHHPPRTEYHAQESHDNQSIDEQDDKYAIITYFFFLKDKEKYAVMRPLNFTDRLTKIGASAKCTTTCSWENYKLFLSILSETRDYLSGRMDDVGLLEAHSFLWALWQI